jgi:uncharacterized iron-regulated membrane protein
MRVYQYFRKTHKWVGILLSVVFLNSALTGILLLEKKNYAWIQPPTLTGAERKAEDFISTRNLVEIVLSQDSTNFRSLEDIDRIDFRLDQRVFKVHSKHNYAEIQVDAVTGEILSTAWRPSDLLEDMHDGSYYAGWLHATLMPVAGGGLVLLSVSGIYLWLAAWLRKRRQKRK